MTQHIVYTTGTRAAVTLAIAHLPGVASAGGSASNSIMQEVADVLLKHISEAFIVKSRGGTDETGERWAPLSPKTIASRLRKKSKVRHPTPPFDKYARSQVDILRDTGKLLKSLTPYTSSSEKVFSVSQSSVIIGTRRKGAAAHHRGIPGRLPQRRLWPPQSNWPSSWWSDILEVTRKGVVSTLTDLIRGAR